MRYKICLRCSHKNVEDENSCLECGLNLAGVPLTIESPDQAPKPGKRSEPTSAPSGQSSEGPPPPLVLIHSKQTNYSFPIRNGAVLGRDAEIDMTPLDPDCYISARHARFSWDRSQWWLEVLSEVNPSKHNGCPLRRGRKFAIRPGDRLEFAGQVFNLKE